MDGFGNINWWGFSPSLDLLETYEASKDEEELNILLVNSGDQRHILHTIAGLSQKPKIKRVNFYIYEKLLELYARDFLLLSLAIEHPSRKGIQEKVELFLDIFGNLLTRDFTSNYIQTKANDFIKLITDLNYIKTKTNLSIFNFELLKYKERDFLEGILKFWRLKLKPEQFPVEKCWEYRLRTYFGVRYDTRTNGYDWDFSMKLSERQNTAIINNRVYSKWRDTGVAFELRDSTYDTANKTLASAMVFEDPRQGDKTSRRGYFGDIIVGPYLTYGIESKNKELFKKQNDMYRHTATDVAKENLTEYLNAILEQNGFKKDSLSQQVEGLKLEEITEENEEEINNKEEKPTESQTEEYIKIDNFTVNFLPLTAFQDFSQKTKYDSFFDVAYFANSGSVLMNKSIKKILKPNALVIFETAKFMIEMTNDQIGTFSDRLKQIAAENSFKDLSKYDEFKEDAKKVKLETLNNLFFRNC